MFDWNDATADRVNALICGQPQVTAKYLRIITSHWPKSLTQVTAGYNIRMIINKLQDNWNQHLVDNQFGAKIM